MPDSSKAPGLPGTLDMDGDGYPSDARLEQIRTADSVETGARWMVDTFPELAAELEIQQAPRGAPQFVQSDSCLAAQVFRHRTALETEKSEFETDLSHLDRIVGGELLAPAPGGRKADEQRGLIHRNIIDEPLKRPVGGLLNSGGRINHGLPPVPGGASHPDTEHEIPALNRPHFAKRYAAGTATWTLRGQHRTQSCRANTARAR